MADSLRFSDNLYAIIPFFPEDVVALGAFCQAQVVRDNIIVHNLLISLFAEKIKPLIDKPDPGLE
jgi:hypothetical protein